MLLATIGGGGGGNIHPMKTCFLLLNIVDENDF